MTKNPYLEWRNTRRSYNENSPVPPVPEAPADAAPRFRFIDGPLSFGDIPMGWTPRAWAWELHRKATRCQALRPDIASMYVAWAEQIEAALHGATG